MAEVGLVFDEVLDVARIVRGTGAEERKQHATRAQDPPYLLRQGAHRQRSEVIEDVPAQHRVDTGVGHRESSAEELRKLIELVLLDVVIDVGAQILDVDLAADPFAEERDVRAGDGTQIHHLGGRPREQQ